MPTRVLIADDNISGRELLRALLTQMQCEVLEASDGAEALELALRYGADLIVLDIQMPRLDGYQTVDALRREKRFADTPIIALSAYAMEADRVKGLGCGFSEFITKPVGPRRLREILTKYLTRANGANCGG